MESDITSCRICFESYNEAERKPLLLPCSHSFCQTCLQTLENEERKDCAFCKKSWGKTALKKLPMCYQLIPAGQSTHGKTRVETCKTHDMEITFWCESCSLAICNTCLEEKHSKCKFVVIQKFRDSERQKDYEKVVGDLLENMSQNNNLLEILMNFWHELNHQIRNCHEWKYESHKRYEKFEEDCEEQEDGSAGLQFAEKRSKTQKEFETLNKEAPTQTLLFHMAKAYQKTPNRGVEEFTKHLHQSVGENRSANASSATETKPNVSVCTFKSGKVWTIKDSPAVIEATRVLRSTCARPSVLEVEGVNLTHNELITLLIEVSEVPCPVGMRFLDIFWNPGKKSVEQTLSRLQTLLKPSYRCTVIQYWAHLDAETVRKLPNTIESVGLILRNADDLQALKALLGVAYARDRQRTELRMWAQLSDMHLCFMQSFKGESWTLYKELISADQWWISAMKNERISLSLHFPFLKLSGLEWMRATIRKTTEDFQYKRIIKKIYLPGSYITAQDFLSSLKDCELRCEVHLHESPQQNKEALEQSYYSIGCSVMWDLEPLWSLNCVIM